MAKGFMRIKLNEASLTKLKANLMKMDINTKAGAKKALTTVAKNIMAQSQSEVPRDTETLLSTAYIEQLKQNGNITSINLGYASPETDKQNPKPVEYYGEAKIPGYNMDSEYAMIVHETPGTGPEGGNYHPYGKWKYLADPVTAHKNELFTEFNMEVRNVVAKGAG